MDKEEYWGGGRGGEQNKTNQKTTRWDKFKWDQILDQIGFSYLAYLAFVSLKVHPESYKLIYWDFNNSLHVRMWVMLMDLFRSPSHVLIMYLREDFCN